MRRHSKLSRASWINDGPTRISIIFVVLVLGALVAFIVATLPDAHPAANKAQSRSISRIAPAVASSASEKVRLPLPPKVRPVGHARPAGHHAPTRSSHASSPRASSAPEPSRPGRSTSAPPPKPSSSHCLPASAETMTNTASHRCGFPDTTNTGVPGNASLIEVPNQKARGPGWTYSNANGLVVTRAGTVINHVKIVGNGIEIKAKNVTIENSVIIETGNWWGIGLYHSSNVTIKNCDISSPYATGPNRLQVGVKDVYGDTRGSRIVDNNIWHTSTAIQVANGVIEGNYIHDYGYSNTSGNDDHLNGISVGGGDSNPLLIQDNTILNSYGQTDAIALFQDFGTEANKTVNDNLMAGGGYSIYGGGPNKSGGGCSTYTNSSGCYGPSSNIVITNNRFSTMYFPVGGQYGPVEAFNRSGPGNVWRNNYWLGGPQSGRAVQ
jgi:hypothetical protein